MTTWWHGERLDAVCAALTEIGPARVADLGCGSGDLLVRLAEWSNLSRLVGLERDRTLLERARRRLGPGRAELVHGSVLDAGPALRGMDAVALVEVIEHIPVRDLPALAHALLGQMAPRRVIVTTPNAEFNRLLGVPAGHFRHRDHRFEWTRAQFRDWSRDVAGRHGYTAAIHPIAGSHPDLGGASQMAVFDRAT